MRFSLIVATVGRTAELERFLASVATDSYLDLEVLVADQNADDRISGVLRAMNGTLEVRHIRTKGGLSRARNAALPMITGHIVAFPDDDCIYPEGLLPSVARAFSNGRDIGGVLGALIDSETGRRFRGFPGHPADVTARNVWQLASSVGLFLRSDVVRKVGDFDESLGLGSGTPWGAGEDRDYVLRAIDSGTRLRYLPSIRVRHPPADYRNVGRAYLYGGGLGRILRKRSAGNAQAMRLILVRPLGGMLLAVVRGQFRKARFYAQSLKGRITGWRGAV